MRRSRSKALTAVKASLSAATVLSSKQIIIGIGNMSGPPGSDPNLYSPASFSVALAPDDNVSDAKKKLMITAPRSGELSEDFGLFEDISANPRRTPWR